MRIGLRIDVDTLRGTLTGVPRLLGSMARAGVRGSFFFSVGPDNMGRHIWRLFRPAFLVKMLRTRAASLYGWDILLKGTLWPGPCIGERAGEVIRSVKEQGHEVGLHAWDHHAWQVRIERMDVQERVSALRRGYETLREIVGEGPCCSAAPAWRVTDDVLLEKEMYPFVYGSDCRGTSLFYPVVNGRALRQPQIPVTLPTYDEAVGRNGIRHEDWNTYLLNRLNPASLNVLTVHAEVEGVACTSLFDRFLKEAMSTGWRFVPLGALLDGETPISTGSIVRGFVAGREGWISYQAQNIPGGRRPALG